MPPLSTTLYTDPGCPWGYSANPDLVTLKWRYGSQLDWRIVMIGLAESPERYVNAGYTPVRSVQGYRTFRRRYGMPFALAPRARIVGTGRACRTVVAVRQQAPKHEWAALRALQFGWFTTPRVMDEDHAIAESLALVEGLDVPAVLAALEDPAVEEAYQADRALTRSAAGGATAFQGKSANTDGAERYTAPSVLFETPDGRGLEAGGFQSLIAYDTCIANLDRSLERRAAAGSAAEVLAEFPEGVTTQELAQVMTSGLDEVDRLSAEDELLALTASGEARRIPLGDDALWRPA
ncbi:MAG: DsbA family protein [Solirubrobacteraceae bacterium]|nr:DsbA family protein [Solirubrobacteraceae bacterium]